MALFIVSICFVGGRTRLLLRVLFAKKGEVFATALLGILDDEFFELSFFDSFVLRSTRMRSTRTMVKPKVYRNIIFFDQILMRACMAINMSGGGDCEWLGWGVV